MIALRVRPVFTGCPGRAALLLGLVVLMAVHLAGAVHGAAFEGPDVRLAAVESAHSARHTPPAGGHEHEHEAHGHIDHAVDRPRGSAHPDDLGTGPADDGLELFPSRPVRPAACPAGRPTGHSAGAAAPQGRSTLALHCVWRV
ncbi:hypothetical protein [Streptomyces sp. 5-6(2022)]|uniref:hypothetical protein n=1 Tax=Streptomyces sp. 5-6(2022) TaxID=2936510 RepID=UPI0023B9E111|nr:hypothetical protein [Streptomyces sp. 5-6(2022)]